MKCSFRGTLVAVLCLTSAARAEFQMPDLLRYEGRSWDLAVFPLDDYEPVRTGAQSLWWAPNLVFAANLRGYVASWEIDDGRLWLTGIEGCQGAFMGDYQPATLASLFPNQADKTRIPADWFSGTLFYPAHRFNQHLLPMSKTQREAQALWTLTIVAGQVTETKPGTPHRIPLGSARHPESIEYYSEHETFDLLARPEVRAELALTADQIAQLEEADARARKQPPSWSSNTRGYPDKSVSAFLTPLQNSRLQELMVQMHGPSIFCAYSPHPALAFLKDADTDLPKKMVSARARVHNRYLDLCNAYTFRTNWSDSELAVLADAIEDIVVECDASALAALPFEWQQQLILRAGEPLPIQWPRHTQRRPGFRDTHARAKAEARRGAGCTTPAIPPGFETIGPDAFRLVSEDVVFRRISPRRLGDPARDFFLMETEVPNRVHALFLADAQRQKGDAELLEQLRTQEQDPHRTWSTADTPYDLQNTNLIWIGNSPPADRDHFPAALITHADAMAFCRWLNQRYPGPGLFWLPTREQWCLAAYGGNQRAYPWGDEWDPDIPHISTSRSAPEREPVAVDSETRDITPEGIRHLGGNVQEYLAAVNPGDDHTAMDTSWAGGSFKSTPSDGCPPTTPRRDYWGYHHGDRSRQEDMGFRLVWIPNGCHSIPWE